MIEARPFGTLPTGAETTLFSLYDGIVTVRVTDLGATIVGIEAPDAAGTPADVVLGYDDAPAYFPNAPYFFGATVGPSANRVEDGAVPIGDTIYRLPANENGNNLHTDHENGLHALIWRADVDESSCSVTFNRTIADGAYGLPGERSFSVRYALSDARLVVTYEATSSAPTFINLTNHSYFNMAGAGAGSVHGQQLMIAAEFFLPIDAASLPTGELRAVAGTPFDFRSAKPIGRDITADDEQLALANGYDHCFCIDGYSEESPSCRRAARALDPASGRGMELWTSLPGLQLYTGNFLNEDRAKGGASYHAQEGFALEPQFYPATPSHPAFPQAIFGPGRPYRARNEYRFFTA